MMSQSTRGNHSAAKFTNKVHVQVGWACMVACLVVGILAGPVLAQLTSEDIEALRRQGEEEGWTFSISENETTRTPLHHLCGMVEPEGWRIGARFDDITPSRGLPAEFDWRDYNGYPDVPIRYQGDCGSCWAFAALGVLEQNIRIKDGGTIVNLSEQWLVSCTTAGDCDGGWHTSAFRFLLHSGWTDPCGDCGAVPENEFPYVAWDAPCNCPYNHTYYIQWWNYVGPQWDVPTELQIKQAVYDHGPVAVSIYANSAFHAFGGGVFNACEDYDTNHGVIIVGWDDNAGADGAWIVRNSWGSWWGDYGYALVPYGCSNVGYAAAYAEYIGQDCNGNSIPDQCDLDCGQPGGECDVAGCGQSDDCNYNEVPDECESQEDCNGNSVLDICDIYAGTSEDCQLNAIPDDCELSGNDCNNNSVPDDCDVVGATSEDCQFNGIPDECELTQPSTIFSDEFPGSALSPANWAMISGATADNVGIDEPSAPYSLRLNGSPDGGDDIQSVAINLADEQNAVLSYYWQRTGGGNSTEYGDDMYVQFRNASSSWVTLASYYGSGSDMTTYEQEIIALPAEAYHANFALRLWNIASVGNYDDWFVDDIRIDTDGADNDCNNNSVPDECDPDCNENGTPDECDLIYETSDDCNNNNRPDECDVPRNYDLWGGFNSYPKDTRMDGFNMIPSENGDGSYWLNPEDTAKIWWQGCETGGLTDRAMQISVPGADGTPPDWYVISEYFRTVGGALPPEEGVYELSFKAKLELNDNPGTDWQLSIRDDDGNNHRKVIAIRFSSTASSVNPGFISVEQPGGSYTNTNVPISLGTCYDFKAILTNYYEGSDSTVELYIDGVSRFTGYAVHSGARRMDYFRVDTLSNGSGSTAIATLKLDTFELTCAGGGSVPVEEIPDCNYNSVFDECDILYGTSLDCNATDIPDECETIAGGDFDADGDVDLADYRGFVACFAGPGASPSPASPECADMCLDAFDFDSDGDIDLHDAGGFQDAFID
ncbi:MAG: hypothetical protein KAV82_01205 [Phycisphaerae bacterium]|nr:hypothetical protein [Phycisphaerae bacterium]